MEWLVPRHVEQRSSRPTHASGRDEELMRRVLNLLVEVRSFLAPRACLEVVPERLPGIYGPVP